MSLLRLNGCNDSDSGHDHDEAEPASASCLASKPKRSISFSPIGSVRPVLQLDDYTDEELDKTWFSQNEYRMMKENIKHTVTMMSHGTLPENDWYCARGLEARTRKERSITRKKKGDARNAVFEAQRIQQQAGYSNPNEIREAYCVFTKHCQAEALGRGFQDQHAACYKTQLLHQDKPMKDMSYFAFDPSNRACCSGPPVINSLRGSYRGVSSI